MLISSGDRDATRIAGEPRARFRQSLAAAFDGATAGAPAHERDIAIGPSRWRLRFAGTPLVHPLSRALNHLSLPPAPGGGEPDLTVLLWDRASTGAGLPDCPWEDPRFRGRGDVEYGWGPDVHAVYSTMSHTLQYLDLAAGFAACWARDPARLQTWERAAPLRALIAGWARRVDGFLIHGAAVGLGGEGLLLTGPSGSGKSTTALACLARGMAFAGDDFVMLARSGVGDLALHALSGSAKVAASELEAAGGLALGPLVRDPAPSDGGKAVLWVNESHPAQMVRSLRLRAIVAPFPTDRPQPVLRRASPIEVLRALLPSSAFLSAGAERRSYADIIQLVRAVPAFVLELGRERAANAEVLERWLREG